jgi:hypothetical protein
MKKSSFQTKVCKLIAENEVKGRARDLLLELAVNGFCRPVINNSRSYNDVTKTIISVIEKIGIPECTPSKKGNYFNQGYYIINDAPKGGKLGDILKINFE